MSFSSKAYLAYEERLLEPGMIIRTGTYKRHHELKKELVLTKPPVRLSEDADNRLQDEFLKSKGVI